MSDDECRVVQCLIIGCSDRAIGRFCLCDRHFFQWAHTLDQRLMEPSELREAPDCSCARCTTYALRESDREWLRQHGWNG